MNQREPLAEHNMAAYREGEAKGLRAVGVNGVLVDAAHVKWRRTPWHGWR